MSTTFRASPGDTFERVSRIVYGVDGEGQRISGANPGVQEPIASGTLLVVPALPGTPQDRPQFGASSGLNETAILINNKRFRFWDSVRVVRAVDTVDSVEFTAPFTPSDSAQRDAFRPFTYPDAEITVNGDTLFTGTLLGPTPSLDPDANTVSVAGYSLPGVLGDCTLPAGVFPGNEFNGQTLEDIAISVAGHFGLSVRFDAPGGAAFDRAACEPAKRVMVFLAELARQRNLVIGSDERGALVFRQSAATGRPVATLEQGQSPLVSVEPNFSPQRYYSHITGVEPVIIGGVGSQYTVKNERLAGVLRPFNFVVPDAVGGDMKPATESKTGRMFGNMASYSVTVNTWRTPGGGLWSPNSTVQLSAPGAMIYNAYKFLVRSVVLQRTAVSETAVLDLVLPGAFSGQLPETLPWDD